MYRKKGFTTGEVAVLCHVTIPTVIKWIESGELEGFKIPGSKNRRITRDSLLKFMKKYNIPTTDLEDMNPRILVVENENNMAKKMKEILLEEEYEVKIVNKGFEAGVAKDFIPDVVVLSMKLTDMESKEVCKHLRDMQDIKPFAVLATHRNLKKDAAQKLLKEGFDDYLKKPFKTDDFMNKLNKLLNKVMQKKHK